MKNSKDLEENGRGLIWRYYPGISLEKLRKTTNNFSQYSRYPGRDLNKGPPEYEAGVLTSQPRRVVRPLTTCSVTPKSNMNVRTSFKLR
jgi:hypothetical protein